MKQISYPPLYISLFFLLMSAVMAASSLSDSLLGLAASSLFWGSFYAIGLFCGYQNSKTKKAIFAQITQAMLIISMFALVITVATRDLIQGLVLFLLWIQAAQNFSLSSRRDVYFAFIVSFVLLMYGAANSKSSGFLFFMIIYVLAGTFTLVANHIDELVCKAKEHGSQLSKTAVGFSSSIGLLSAAIITLAILFYLFVPRPAALNYGAFMAAGGLFYENKEWEEDARNNKSFNDDISADRDEQGLDDDVGSGSDDQALREGLDESDSGPGGSQNGGEGAASKDKNRDKNSSPGRFEYSGFENSFDIDQSRDGRPGNGLVMYVASPRPLYLRGPVYDHFENNRWSKRLHGDSKHKLAIGEVRFGEESDDLIVQTITLKQNITSTIFAAEEVRSLNFPGSVIARDRYGVMLAPQTIREGTVYSVKSKLANIDGRLIADPKPLLSRIPYLQSPNRFNNDIYDLARSVSRHASDDLGKSIAIEQHLRNSYEYTFDTVGSPNGVLIDDFLFNTKKGHCELFATSMVMMLRSIGIPARLATGFSATNMNPMTGYYEVRGLDAHAWVEAYIDNAGWVMFEPTAFYNLPQESPPDTTAEALKQYLENLTKGEEIIDPDGVETLSMASLLDVFNQIGELFEFLWEGIKGISNKIWTLVIQNSLLLSLVALLIVGGIFSFRYIKHALFTCLALARLKARVKGNPEQFLDQCYTELENYFSRKGDPRKPGWTTQEYAASLSHRYQALSGNIKQISNMVNLVCYSPYQASAKDAEVTLSDFKKIVDHEKRK